MCHSSLSLVTKLIVTCSASMTKVTIEINALVLEWTRLPFTRAAPIHDHEN